MTREAPRAEAGRETLQLRLDRFGHVGRGRVRYMAIGPRRVIALGGATRIKQAGLGHKHERAIGCAPVEYLPLRGGDIVERSTDVDGAGAGAFDRLPGDRPTESPVDLKNAGTIALRLELALKSSRQTGAGHLQELPGGEVAEHERGFAQFIEGADTRVRNDLPPERFEVGSERVSDLLRSALRDRPPGRVCGDGEQPSECGGAKRLERENRVRREARKERPRRPWVKKRGGGECGGPRRKKDEAREQHRVCRKMNRPQNLPCELRPLEHERSHLPAVNPAIRSEERR